MNKNQKTECNTPHGAGNKMLSIFRVQYFMFCILCSVFPWIHPSSFILSLASPSGTTCTVASRTSDRKRLMTDP